MLTCGDGYYCLIADYMVFTFVPAMNSPDMLVVEKKVRTVEHDGLLWGAGE